PLASTIWGWCLWPGIRTLGQDCSTTISATSGHDSNFHSHFDATRWQKDTENLPRHWERHGRGSKSWGDSASWGKGSGHFRVKIYSKLEVPVIRQYAAKKQSVFHTALCSLWSIESLKVDRSIYRGL